MGILVREAKNGGCDMVGWWHCDMVGLGMLDGKKVLRLDAGWWMLGGGVFDCIYLFIHSLLHYYMLYAL